MNLQLPEKIQLKSFTKFSSVRFSLIMQCSSGNLIHLSLSIYVAIAFQRMGIQTTCIKLITGDLTFSMFYLCGDPDDKSHLDESNQQYCFSSYQRGVAMPTSWVRFIFGKSIFFWVDALGNTCSSVCILVSHFTTH